MINQLNRHDFKDILSIDRLCISYIKAGRIECKKVFSEICRVFKANNVVFSPLMRLNTGADLNKAFDLYGNKWSFDRYAKITDITILLITINLPYTN